MMYLQIVTALESRREEKKEKTTRKAHNENCKRIQSNIIMVKKAGAKGGKRRPLSARFGLFLAA
jgi:hypothetical protein